MADSNEVSLAAIEADELYDSWMDRQLEFLQMAYCVTCKCFVGRTPGTHHDKNEHEHHILATTSGQKASEEVIARLSE